MIGAAARLSRRRLLLATLYALMLPTAVGTLLFTYYPNIDAVKHAFYRWDGSHVEEFRGLQNFKEAFTADPLFWRSFGLVGILLAANAVKMWPSIFVAIAIHRLRDARWQYLYRVAFVVPMVIPGLVWLLIWKALFTEGLLNQVLNLTGVMAVLRFLDSPTHGLPAVASALSTAPVLVVAAPFAAGAAILALIAARSGAALRALPRPALERTKLAAWIVLALTVLLVLLTQVWPQPTHAFDDGDPPWLGNSKLIIPALILWGFPWVGTIGVLIYLAGLQGISQEIYEAADLDGVGSWGKIFRIELPLIMSQVRINLIFMTIATLTDYAFFLILLGPSGGPGNSGMVPGLYMYQKAFIQGEFGYACALGMILFAVVLALTFLYQRYLKVDK